MGGTSVDIPNPGLEIAFSDSQGAARVSGILQGYPSDANPFRDSLPAWSRPFEAADTLFLRTRDLVAPGRPPVFNLLVRTEDGRVGFLGGIRLPDRLSAVKMTLSKGVPASGLVTLADEGVPRPRGIALAGTPFKAVLDSMPLPLGKAGRPGKGEPQGYRFRFEGLPRAAFAPYLLFEDGRVFAAKDSLRPQGTVVLSPGLRVDSLAPPAGPAGGADSLSTVPGILEPRPGDTLRAGTSIRFRWHYPGADSLLLSLRDTLSGKSTYLRALGATGGSTMLDTVRVPATLPPGNFYRLILNDGRAAPWLGPCCLSVLAP